MPQVRTQVVSFGQLGVLGRNGWYCREADVEHFNALAGYRGLKDPAVRQHFNRTLLAFEAGWGPNEDLMTNLGLRYEVANLGADAAPIVIQARLDAFIPTLFYLWSPHVFNARYALNRIQLPQYSPARYKQALSDYPTDVLEKIAAKTLSELVPAVAELYSQFVIDNAVQESVLGGTDTEGLSVMHAACGWMRKEENVAVWTAWLPAAACDAGQYVSNASGCGTCPPGTASVGGAATTCVQCSAGAAPQSVVKARRVLVPACHR